MVYINNYCGFVQMHKYERAQICKMMICIFAFD